MGDYGIVIPRYMGAQLKNDINGPSALHRKIVAHI